MATPIDIIIPVYQDDIPQIVTEAVDRILRYTKDVNIRLVVSSRTQPKNINSAIENVKSKYYVIMDWDVLVSENWLPPLVEIMDKTPDCGILGVRMEGNYVGLNQYVSPGETKKAQSVAGGMMLCRNIKLKWDESFPSGYWCDADFCCQYEHEGYSIYLTGVVTVVHNPQTCAKPEFGDLSTQGREIFEKKWFAEMFKDKVSILVLSWNQLKTVKVTIKNALADGLEVWVVDNGSTDGTQEYLKTVEGIHTILFDKNMGISYARNRVIENFTRDYLMMIDGDIAYIPKSAEGMIFELSMMHPSAYCLGIHNLENGEGSPTFEGSDKVFPGLGVVSDDFPIAWTQYGLFKGDIIRKYKFPEYGVFYGEGWGFEDDWIHAKLSEDGYTSLYCTKPFYWHNDPHTIRDTAASRHNERREELQKRFPSYVHWSER